MIVFDFRYFQDSIRLFYDFHDVLWFSIIFCDLLMVDYRVCNVFQLAHHSLHAIGSSLNGYVKIT